MLIVLSPVTINKTFYSLNPSAGSSSFESQKMDRPSISVMSPTSPGTLRDLPMVLPGQLSVSIWRRTHNGSSIDMNIDRG